MSGLEFVASLVDSAAWPIAVVAAAYLLRRELAALLDRLREVRHRDTTLTFGEGLQEAEAEAEGAALPKPSVATSQSELPSVVSDATGSFTAEALSAAIRQSLIAVADASPRAAVIEGWQLVEGALAAAAERVGVKWVQHRPTPMRLLGTLTKKGSVDAPTAEVIADLRRLRNQAAHASTTITKDEALRYIDLAIQVDQALHDIGRDAWADG